MQRGLAVLQVLQNVPVSQENVNMPALMRLMLPDCRNMLHTNIVVGWMDVTTNSQVQF